MRQGSADGTRDISILTSNKLSVSYQGKPVDAATVDWNHANIGKYTFTQEPGPDNVLGVLKFNFPNRHAIYMHDTIQPELFSETERSLSHGCIRVRQPDRLAALLLAEDKGWSPQQVKDLLAKGKNSGVTLSRPVPVHLTYFTAGGRRLRASCKPSPTSMTSTRRWLTRCSASPMRSPSPPEPCRASAAPGTAKASARFPACSATELAPDHFAG